MALVSVKIFMCVCGQRWRVCVVSVSERESACSQL